MNVQKSGNCYISGAADEKTKPQLLAPVFFSLDIDSYDYWVASALLYRGFRPAIVIVEYNAAIDPDVATVPRGAVCEPNFLYFGCSLAAWKKLWVEFGYEFVTVCSAGINAFFVESKSIVDRTRLDAIRWLGWMDCTIIASYEGTYFERHERLKLLYELINV